MRAILWLLGVAALAGCAVGPDFKRPDPPSVGGYTAAPLPAQTAAAAGRLGGAQRFGDGAVSASWWQALGSARLDALIERALRASPTLEAAQATVRQAGLNYEARAGSTLYPQANAGLGAQRQQANNAAAGQPGGERLFDLYTASVGVSYNLDLAGGNRRALEALAAQADYQRYQLEGARLTLAANIAAAAIAQAQLVAQVRASAAILAFQQEQLELTRRRLALGSAAESEVLAQQTRVEQTRATLAPLQNRLDQTGHLLAMLAGDPPGAAGMSPFELDEFTLPADLPLSLPSELVRRRPDIRGAEALLHAANAQHGAAVSKLYPQLTLSASLGSQALTTAGLFGSGAAVWGVAGQLVQPIFNGGLRAEARAAEAGFDAAEANYRQTVLQALRNVADALRSLEHDARTLAAQAAADAAARESLRLVQQQYALGAVSYLQLLVAQQQAQQTGIEVIAGQAQRLSDTVALYQAMGGGRLTD